MRDVIFDSILATARIVKATGWRDRAANDNFEAALAKQKYYEKTKWKHKSYYDRACRWID